MIRDTFENNPGLRELFKRKIVERARFVGLSEGMIDFDSQIDLKGTYGDNLRTFYREYPQLSKDSDYFGVKTVRPLRGVALEKTWQAYERNSGHRTGQPAEQSSEQPKPQTDNKMLPELVITYTLGTGPRVTSDDLPAQPTSVFQDSMIQQAEPCSAASIHSEFARSILERVTAITGEKIAKLVLHQIGQDIGATAYNHSQEHNLFHDPVEGLDHVLMTRGLGRVLNLDKIDVGPNVAYVCKIMRHPSCHAGASPSPTCQVMHGVVARWLECILQRKADHIETSCASGSQPCVIRVSVRK